MLIKFFFHLSSGSYGGGLIISLTGSGFAGDKTQITICGSACLVSTFTNANQISCIVKQKNKL